MKVIHSSFFRAICAIIVGALLIQYREQTVTCCLLYTSDAADE